MSNKQSFCPHNSQRANKHLSSNHRQDKLLVPSAGCLVQYDVSEPSAPKQTVLWQNEEHARLDCKLSPDGKLVAFVQDDDLWCAVVGSAQPAQRLTHHHEKSANKHAGAAGFNLEEEFDQYSGFWWSPVVGSAGDSSSSATYQILFTVEDDSAVETHSIPHDDGSGAEVYKYPRTGTANTTVETRLLHITLTTQPTEAAQVAVEESAALDQSFGGRFDDVEYIPRAGWMPDGTKVWFQLLDRRQQHLRLVLVDVAAYGSSGSVTVVVDERSKTWFNITDTCRALSDGSLLWDSEETGFRQLYLLTPRVAGAPHGAWDKRQLTAQSPAAPQLLVGRDTNQLVVDERCQLILFSATLTTPLRSHVCAVSYAPGADPTAVVRVTPEDKHVSHFTARCYDLSGERVHVVAASVSNARSPCPLVLVATLRSSMCVEHHGHLKAAEPVRKAEQCLYEEPEWVVPEFFSLRSKRHGQVLYGMVFLPRQRDGSGKVPVVVDVYGGPHHQSVVDCAMSRTVPKRQLLCALGYAVLCVDNVGSDNRGAAFEAFVRERMGTVEIADQVEALEHAAAQYGLDLGRVALTGWSYGGYATLLGLAQRPDVFRVAFAGAPVTAWELYDTGYTERYMGLPATERDAYAAASVLALAERFPREQGRLLIVHGTQDENVHFEHTRALVERFDALGVPYRLIRYPGEHHGVRQFGHVLEMMTVFVGMLSAGLQPASKSVEP